MYVIAKKVDEIYWVLSEVWIASEDSYSPSIFVSANYEYLDFWAKSESRMREFMVFENKSDAYALLIALKHLGKEIAGLLVIDMEGVYEEL